MKLITQRSVVQIHPPQPTQINRLHGSVAAPKHSLSSHYDTSPKNVLLLNLLLVVDHQKFLHREQEFSGRSHLMLESRFRLRPRTSSPTAFLQPRTFKALAMALPLPFRGVVANKRDESDRRRREQDAEVLEPLFALVPERLVGD
jgi:hypothetical protein